MLLVTKINWLIHGSITLHRHRAGTGRVISILLWTVQNRIWIFFFFFKKITVNLDPWWTSELNAKDGRKGMWRQVTNERKNNNMLVRWLQEVHQVSCELYVRVNSILLKDFPLTWSRSPKLFHSCSAVWDQANMLDQSNIIFILIRLFSETSCHVLSLRTTHAHNNSSPTSHWIRQPCHPV